MDEYARIEEWFLAYGSDVHHFLVYFLGQNQVEDLVQEVFVKAMKGLPNFGERAGPKTWLFAIARNVAIDHERRNKLSRLLSLRLKHELSHKTSIQDDSLGLREELEDAYRIMRSLKREFREVLMLRVMEGFSAAETAEIIGWTTTKVNVTLHRALKKAREGMKQLQGGMKLAARTSDRE